MSDTVQRSLEVPAPVEDVWDLLRSPAGLGEWLADEVDADAIEPGEDAVFRYEDGEERRATIDEVVEEERIAFSWWRADGPPSRVVVSVRAVEIGTRVTVVETAERIPGMLPTALAAGIAAGWEMSAARLELAVGRVTLCA